MKFIGIDVGVHTGMAVWNGSSFDLITTTDIISALDYVRDLHSKERVKVYVEDARLRTWFGNTKGKDVLQGAGSVKRDSQIWDDALTKLGIEHEMIHPRNNVTKMNAKYFAFITDYKGRTSEHARDAAMLVFQRTEKTL